MRCALTFRKHDLEAFAQAGFEIEHVVEIFFPVVAGFSPPASIGRKRGGTVEPYLDFYGDAALAVISC